MGNICCKSRKKAILEDNPNLTILPKLIHENQETQAEESKIENGLDNSINKKRIELLCQRSNSTNICQAEKLPLSKEKQETKVQTIKFITKEESENLFIEDTFLITLKSDNEKKILLYLDEYFKELQSGGSDLLLRINDIDSTLLHLINHESKVY
jgi:hypothetical protein